MKQQIHNGTLRRWQGQWWAHFAPGGVDKFGGIFAYGCGASFDQATHAALHAAEVDFGFHGAVCFTESQPKEWDALCQQVAR